MTFLSELIIFFIHVCSAWRKELQKELLKELRKELLKELQKELLKEIISKP